MYFCLLTSDYWSFCFSSSPNLRDLSFFNPLFSLPQKIIHLVNRLNVICRSLYKLYAPDGLKHRKNVDQTKLPDSSILAMLIWQTEIGIESQRRFCKFFVGLSHSRFNRRARMLLSLIRCIRQAWNQEVKTAGEFLIIDSFPVPVCQPVRNYRVKIFRGVADIGYNATKKVYYYGFKVHAIVSDDGN